MTTDALDTEYESAIADILGFLVGDTAVVERNVHLPGTKTGVPRQVDVKLTGHIFGVDGATMIVDAKRHKKPIGIKTVGELFATVDDIGASFGLIVTNTGVSKNAQRYANNLEGIFVDILSLEELESWRPRGTVHFDYAIPWALYPEAARALRRAGYRVVSVPVDDWRGLSDHRGMSALRYLGTRNPSGEAQAEMQSTVLTALSNARVEDPISMGTGVTIAGGTPCHRWLEASDCGRATGVKVLVASEADISAALDRFASHTQGAARENLDVVRPALWPIPAMFSPLS